jgi:hypothetical protein
MRKVDNFNPGQWLIENKLTSQSKLTEIRNSKVFLLERLTREEFIERAQALKKHQNPDETPKYTYDKVNYVDGNTPVIITCPKHGDWDTTVPRSHLDGAGCPKCGMDNTKSSIVKYDKDTLKKIALQYNTKRKFEKGNQSAYQAAIKLGPCYDKTTGEEVPCMIYDKERKNLISRPNTTNSFGFLNSISSHMKSGGFYGEKIVYSYTFFDDKNEVVGIYVGLTNDEERRKQQHLSPKENEVKSAVGKFIKENPNFKYRYKKLTNMVDFELAKWYEDYYEKKYRSKGYRILNIAKTGSGGKTFIPNEYHIDKAQDWIKTKLENGEIPYINDYIDFDETNYKAIRYKKLMDAAFKGMEYKDQKKYSDEDIINAAMSSESYSDFINKYKIPFAQQARRRGLIPQIKQMFNDGLNTPKQITPSI